jgi:aryl carrier-like protein
LVAYVVGTAQLDLEALKIHIRQNLPDYMMPSNIIQLNSLPKLPNGKINTRALQAIQRDSQSVPAGAENTNQKEQALIRIWEEVIGFEPIGPHDNFFEIGGDSILSIQIVAKARSAGLNFTPNQLFRHQTIGELASVLEHSTDTAKTSESLSRNQTDGSSDFSSGGLSPKDINQLMDQINKQRDKE